MANKKDSEHEEHEAENEALKAKIQNEFLKMTLAPDELLAQEEPTISPAVVLDENYEETPSVVSSSQVQLPPKIMEEETQQPIIAPKVASNDVKQPELKPASKVNELPKRKPSLGAAEFLLSGTLPKKEEPPQQSNLPPVESKTSEGSEEAPKKETELNPTSQDEKKEDEGESKGGMFAKAKSLFSNITKKDKKE